MQVPQTQRLEWKIQTDWDYVTVASSPLFISRAPAVAMETGHQNRSCLLMA